MCASHSLEKLKMDGNRPESLQRVHGSIYSRTEAWQEFNHSFTLQRLRPVSDQVG
jgi:hypothetical protein